jgi:hypothetical protein
LTRASIHYEKYLIRMDRRVIRAFTPVFDGLLPGDDGIGGTP